ncbi:alkaline phosphatase family protein [Kocuria sp. p3-SID1433]|uniref:alkaline phosphatase family protein n=1 Tax=unclassified Kocuria TaxID=2649579 RepID=UPI0021A705FF|nr:MULTISPECIES: alkaline phosphatase family protein [unclassified Kocuria]MCT1601700.1 alkaline phosphatase family protein [Kocuria sp. p3-SID1428]MCT2179738.1 alkaline phosphatase family protein [Kocuria sp. p3-SID1433]
MTGAAEGADFWAVPPQQEPQQAAARPPRYGARSIADVMTSAAAAIGAEGFDDVLGISVSQRVVVVLVDGLGLEQLEARSSYAPFLRGAEDLGELDAAFPSTTASSLASLGTGLPVGVHGLTGYDSYSPQLGEAVNMLGGWDPRVEARAWQPHDTVLQRLEAQGLDAVTVSRGKFRDSALTRAALRGGRFVSADGVFARTKAAQENLRAGQRGVMYFYWDDLDKTGHRHGWGSSEWIHELEELDSSLRRLCSRLPQDTSVVLTADHGMVDVPREGRVDLMEIPGLLDDVRTSAGEPRCLQLHLEPSGTPEQRLERQERVRQRWEASVLGERVRVQTREQLLEAGWFGPVEALRPEVIGRIGDVVITPLEDGLALHDLSRIGAQTLGMVGQHGAMTPAETRVPLLRLS